MALTLAERSSVRRLLGYGDRIIGEYHVLENAMDTISSTGEVELRCALERVVAVEAQLDDSLAQIGVNRVDTIELDTNDLLGGLWAEGNRHVQAVATVLEVAVVRLPFGPGSGSGSGQAGRR